MLRDAAWCCVMLRGAAWCCVVLRGAAWCCVVFCVVLRSAAWCCVMLRGDGMIGWWMIVETRREMVVPVLHDKEKREGSVFPLVSIGGVLIFICNIVLIGCIFWRERRKRQPRVHMVTCIRSHLLFSLSSLPFHPSHSSHPSLFLLLLLFSYWCFPLLPESWRASI